MMCRAAIVVGLVLVAHTALADQEQPYDFEEKPWIESETTLPEFPRSENLIEFYVGPTERNHFFVDGSTIIIGADDVVRYVLVLKTAGGASNVTLEGIRCGTHEVKPYALGRADATWNKLPNQQWKPIENKTVNQYRAVLSRDIFCPAGRAPRDPTEARAALRRGHSPEMP